MTNYSLRHQAAWRGAGRRRRPRLPSRSSQPRRRRSSRSSVELRHHAATPGTPPRLAVPDLLALSNDRETQDAARTIAQVLWDDLNYEREFYMIPRDTYKSIPPAAIDRHGAVRSLARARRRRRGDRHGAEGRPTAFASRCGCTACVRGSRLYGREYTGSAANPRLYAHTMADEIHQSQRNLRGVARTKLAFVSDRNREPVVGDGREARRQRDLHRRLRRRQPAAHHHQPQAEHHAELVARRPVDRLHVVSHRRARHPDLEHLRRHDGEPDARDVGQNFLPVFSPDGTRIAFMSNRDGNTEIYVMNRDGSDVRRLTNNPAIDAIADVVADRHADRVYVGAHRHAADLRRWTSTARDRAAIVRVVRRSRDLVAGAVQRDRVHGAHRAGLRHQDPEHRQRRDAADHVRRRQQREPGVVAERTPSGVHVDARGRSQIFTVDRDGRNVRQITRDGNNTTPHWSQ